MLVTLSGPHPTQDRGSGQGLSTERNIHLPPTSTPCPRTRHEPSQASKQTEKQLNYTRPYWLKSRGLDGSMNYVFGNHLWTKRQNRRKHQKPISSSGSYLMAINTINIHPGTNTECNCEEATREAKMMGLRNSMEASIFCSSRKQLLSLLCVCWEFLFDYFLIMTELIEHLDSFALNFNILKGKVSAKYTECVPLKSI